MTDADLRRLIELAGKATPGERELWTGCSWKRIGIKNWQVDRPIIEPIVARDGWPDLLFANQADADLVIACSPERIAALARVALAASPVLAGIDNWNAAVSKIIGRQVEYEWGGLEELRAAIAALEAVCAGREELSGG